MPSGCKARSGDAASPNMGIAACTAPTQHHDSRRSAARRDQGGHTALGMDNRSLRSSYHNPGTRRRAARRDRRRHYPRNGSLPYSTLIARRFAFVTLGRVSSSTPSLKPAFALSLSISAGRVTVRENSPRDISMR